MNASRLRDDGRIEIDRALTDSAATREYIDSAFELRFRVTIGSDLEMELGTTNRSNKPFTFEQALHTYLAVGGIQDASVYGLDGS
jgi:D-hexose-6-phosphate mutarotase